MILDVDPGLDDAVAIMLACGAQELDVRAVTTVAGNVSLEKTTANALKVLSFLGRGDVPVGAGAEGPLRGPLVAAEDVHGADGLGGIPLPEPTFGPDGRGAVGLMADALREAAEPVTLVALAPLTNVAILLREHPELKARVARIVLMGGSMGPGNVTPHAEFNVHADPEAAREVFESGLPITMVGLDATRESGVAPEEAARMLSLGRMGELAARLVGAVVKGGGPSGLRTPPVHDAVAVACVIEPGMVRTRRMRVDVEQEGEARGRTVCGPRGVEGRASNADVGVGLDRGAFFRVLFRALARLAG
ncbi:nucleoside hydrolase [Rubrobacter marinus]|uniref:nucleoside hydrolase n=1 Tax=Rubrobacter marinus TaxID=2653852 RepID=UPI001A9FBB57|nr:nucleoside hydrolase [Rubrobacter marinus]